MKTMVIILAVVALALIAGGALYILARYLPLD
jgi:hypothetical protein